MHKIEVQFSQNLARFAVSLFTREWIEITGLSVAFWGVLSPSLRGSGLKCVMQKVHDAVVGLPLYEGVD